MGCHNSLISRHCPTKPLSVQADRNTVVGECVVTAGLLNGESEFALKVSG
jgi:hypothetical protein